MEAICYAGADVAKAKFDMAMERGGAATFAQTSEGFGQAVVWLKERGVTHVVLEPTGGYERRLTEALRSAGFAVCQVAPDQVRAFAKAKGVHAKTDALDARLLANFGRTLEPPSRPQPDEATLTLAEIVRRRRHVVEFLVEERERRGQVREGVVAKMIDAHIAMLKAQLVEIDKAVAQAIAERPEMARKQDVLKAVKGVGEVTAAVLIAEMPELGSLDAKKAAALAGLAPFNRDSGQSSKKAYVRGGRPGVRCALYMAAVSAIRHNAEIGVFYKRLRAAGKPAKVALIAAARKLIVILNAKLRDAAAFGSQPQAARV